jgi:DNA-binding transcriptional LysR family regulator
VASVRLAAIDLNLLVAFDALMAEQNVTQAAARVGLTQSAMSHALDRLRKLFDDPLLVRTSRGMLPTPCAQKLIGPVRRALGDITQALTDERVLRPSEVRRTVTLACSDVAALLVVPALYSRLGAEASGVDVIVRPLQADLVERQLVDGEVDVALGAPTDVRSNVLLRQKLLQDRLVCCARAGHQATARRLSLEEFAALEHVSVLPNDPIDAALDRHDLRRRIALTTSLLAAPAIVARSNLVLTVPERVARTLIAQLPLRTFDAPSDLDKIVITQFWHERQTRDALHVWLRTLVVDACREI